MDAPTLVIGLHLLSLHTPSHWHNQMGQHEYNKATIGAYVKSPSGWTFGAYRNSYHEPSAYFGKTIESQDRRFALLLAGVVGYRRSAVLPFVVPSARFEVAGQAFRIAAAPRMGTEAGFLHLGVEWTW